jgi:hypothetical protein
MFPPETSDIAFEEPKAADSCHQPGPCNYAEVPDQRKLAAHVSYFMLVRGAHDFRIFRRPESSPSHAEQGHMLCYGRR